MTAPCIPPNAYTNAPDQHPNLFLGSLQLLFWIFFRPAAWRNHIARIDPTLRPDFCLAELSSERWRNLALRRLLFQSYLILPLLAGLLIGGSLLVIEQSGETIAYGVAYGVAIGVAYSMVGGMAGIVAIGGAVGVAVGVARVVKGFESSGVAGVIAGIVAVGIIVGVVSSVGNQKEVYSLTRQTGGIITGLLLGIVAVVMTGGVVALIVGILVGIKVSEMVSNMFISEGIGKGIGVLYGIAIGVMVPVIIVVVGVVVVSGAVSVVVSGAGGVVSGMVVGVAIVTLFALPYGIAEQIAGSWAGGIAGAVSCSGVWLLAAASQPDSPSASIWIGGGMGLVAGLTLSWWHPVLFYLVTAVLNMLLYRLDEQRTNRSTCFLRYHSAFWDDYQRLPLLGLDSHIVLVAEHCPAEAQAAIEYLSTSHQRWAAQAAQIELDARYMERCADTVAIGQIHQGLLVSELDNPASALFRSFKRISEDVNAALNQGSVYNRRLALTSVGDRLDNLLRELTRSSDKYAVRFRAIAHRWCRIIGLELKELKAVAELRQEIDSPYIIGVPLTERQAIFVGRTDISSRIEQLLLDRQSPPLLLYGQRRMGKTSLLNNLGRLLPNSIIPLFVDLQGPASRASNHAGFLYNLAKGMADSAQKQRNLVLPPLSREALIDDPFTRFDEWLDEVEARLQDNIALLELDEFEVLDQVLVKGLFSETAVLGMLRNLIQHRLRFKVLLSGSHTLAEFQRWSSYLINAKVLHLGFLKESEARQLIEQPIEGFALRYQPDASQHVLNVTRGHPFLVQLLCAEIVALKNDQDPSIRCLATLANVEAAIPTALSSGSMFFSDIERNQVDANALKVLRYLAAQGEAATVSEMVLANQFPDGWREAIDHLQRRELIELTDNGYRFQVELIRRWFIQ
jgi:hypothetical protein